MGRYLANLRLNSRCYVLILPTFVLLALFVYLPVLWAFEKSLYRFEIGEPPEWIGLGNFAEYGQDPTLLTSFRNMIFLTVFAVAVRLTVPLAAAKLIISLPSERSRYLYRILFLVPIVVPGVAIQMIWAGMMYSDSGLINEVLRSIGLADLARGWLSDPKTALVAIAFVGFPWVGGFEVLIYYAGLAAIPEDVSDAARIDGATGLQKFLRIDVPLVLSQVKLLLILTIIGGVQGFENVLILTRGNPGFETMVPGLWMYLNAFSFQRMGYACAIGVILFILIFGLTVLNMRYFKSSEQVQQSG